MHWIRSLIFLFGISAISGYDWKCESISADESPKNSVDWCKVTNLSRYDLLQSEHSIEHGKVPQLLLVKYRSSLIQPWMQKHFSAVDHVYFNESILTSLYVFPTLKTLSVSFSDVSEIVLNQEETYLLESIIFKNTYFPMPNNISILKHLSSVDVECSKHPTLNLSLFDGLMDLKKIRFYDTHTSLVAIPADINLPGLRKLNLGFNELKSIPDNINHLKGLEEIDLSCNNIAHVEMTAFDGLGNLISLELYGNMIASISSADIINLPNLRTYSLDYNHLKELDVQNWKMPNLTIFSVSENKLPEILNVNALFRVGFLILGHYNPWSCQFLEQMPNKTIYYNFIDNSFKCLK